MLNLLPQIPIDILFHTQIPLTITYHPESSVYRKWHPEQGGVSPLHKEIRASCTLSKVLGEVTHQPSESVGGSPSPTPSDNSAGSSGSLGSRCWAHSQVQSVTPACSQQPGSAGSVAGCHSAHSQATKNGEVSSSESDSSQGKVVGAEEEDNTEEGKGGIKTSSDEQEASDGEDQQEPPHTQDTLTGVSQLFGEHEDTEGRARTVPRRTAPRQSPVDHSLPRKSHQLTRHSETECNKKHGCLTHALMLGIATKLPTMSHAGQCETP